MSSQNRMAAKLLGAILLVGLALFCGYGFLASYELGFPNVWHAIYGGTGVAAVIGAVWLIFPALKSMITGTADPQWAGYWRPLRLAAFFSLFSVVALMTGNFANLAFLLFLLFLLPVPSKRRTQPCSPSSTGSFQP
jgi:hypothetical protein